ncbi:MAG: cell surface protein SprA [Bacteroidales bacterium]
MKYIARFCYITLSLLALLTLAGEVYANDSDGRTEWKPQQKDEDLYEIDYDERSDLYSFYRKEQNKAGQPVKVMNSDDYRRYQFDQSLRSAWENRRNGDMASGNEKTGGGISKLLPNFKINASLVTNLLSGDLIKFNLQGFAEVVFGYDWRFTDNPTIPEQYRSNGVFDFKLNMQLNASGSIGDRITIDFIKGTDMSFNWQDLVKINYQGDEDDILQKIEAGNVSLPLSGSLITGSQSLFGIKAALRFGHLDIEGVISEQKGQSTTVNVKGGAQTSLFDITADKYDANRHFFLTHFFRSQYNDALKYLPVIQSGVNITRLEVWVTNRSNRFDNARSIVALDTLGGGGRYPNNTNNALYQRLKDNAAARQMSTVNTVLEAMGLNQSRDYEKVENARRLTDGTDYTFNQQLGYLSLTNALNGDEVLAVAFEYTAGGKIYRVGEFYDDGIVAPNALFLKLLKGTNLSPRYNTWNLMMKNVYNLEAYQLSQEDFELNIMYRDESLGGNVPYIAEGNTKNLPLLQVLNLDNLNSSGTRQADGKFDFVDGITVQSSGGRVIFPVLEPFGRDLGAKVGYPTANKYIFNELYDSTLVRAQQFANKNKFRLTGSYRTSSTNEIILGASDIPEGAVVVTAGGIKLIENVDYTVNYSLGRVQIINPVYLGSNVPLQVSVESFDNYAFTRKTFMGANVKYKLTKNFSLGATVLRLSETPLTEKVTYGEEPIKNVIWGFNNSYTTEVNMLTKMVDAIPLLSTKAASRVTVEGEFAHLIPGHSRSIGVDGTTYIDDFEASKMTVDLRQYTAWSLASTPVELTSRFQSQFAGSKLTNDPLRPLSNDYYRAHLAWHVIDPLFLRNTSNTPAYIRNDPKKFRKNHYVREVHENEIFPNKDIVIGTDANIAVFNLAYYPNERGAYNYIDFAQKRDHYNQFKGLNKNGSLKTPRTNFGAIMRAVPITDFENANVEYIEFWMLDPFIYNRGTSDAQKQQNGRLYFNLGNVSEDVLKDGRKSFENGMPYPYDTALVEKTKHGYVPRVQSLNNTFDNNEAARVVQDVGFDGLNNEQERSFFEQEHQYLSNLRGIPLADNAYARFEDDPSNDLYHYYRGSDYDAQELSILDRYKRYNMPQGNSPVATGGLSSSATTMPNTEDINRDNTLNELESYYEYFIELNPDIINPNNIGQNYITDVRTVNMDDADYEEHQQVHWYQFKIPIANGKAVNGIEDFKSIRFVRAILSGFDTTVICRFARLELVRAEWRRYEYSLRQTQEGTALPELGTGTMDAAVINIEENAGRQPINYILPPGINREIDNANNQQLQRNEQAMMLTVNNLSDGDARAVYKNATYDMREFRRIQMDIHAEAIDPATLRDNDLSLFIRLGNDYNYNYYEYEIPLKLTPWGRYTDAQREEVWRPENKLDIPLSIFTDLKLDRNDQIRENKGVTLRTIFEVADGKNMARIMGNPNLAEVRVLMIGVRNPTAQGMLSSDDGLSKNGIIWVNELRFTNFAEEGGWAANLRVATNFADFANLAVAGSVAKAGFGSLDSRPTTRSRENTYQYDITSLMQFGKFFPSKFGVSLPLSIAFAESYILPEYNPFDPDIKLTESISRAGSREAKDSIRNITIDYTMRKNIALNGVHIQGTGDGSFGPIEISNFTAGYSFSENLARNENIQRDYEVEHRINGAYAYGPKPYVFEPFSKIRFMQGEYWRIIKDFNFTTLPTQYGFNTEYIDRYTEYIIRSFYPGLLITPITTHELINTRNYTFGWDIARSLKFNLSAQNTSRKDLSAGSEADTIVQNNAWRNISYSHEFGLNYVLPLQKLPFLSWTNITSSYKGTYSWDAPLAFATEGFPDLGNTLRNSNSFQINGGFNFMNLYDKSDFLKSINQKFDGRQRPKMKDIRYEEKNVELQANARITVRHNLKVDNVKVRVLDAQGKRVDVVSQPLDNRSVYIVSKLSKDSVTIVIDAKVPDRDNPAIYIAKLATRLLMSVRNASISYTRDGETTLPGYTPKTTLIGLDHQHNFNAPGWDFILGSQSSNWRGNFFSMPEEYMLTRAHENQWIIQDSSLINPFVMQVSNNLSFRTSIEPFRDLRIDLTASQTYTNSYAWYDINNNGSRNPFEVGTFSMTGIAIRSAFENSNSQNLYASQAYDQFNQVRLYVAQQLAQQHYGSNVYSVDSLGFPVGFSQLSQEVLIPAFEIAYLGKGNNKKTINYRNFLSKIPMPNWQISYNGLSRISALKPYVRSVTLQHAYRCTYNFAGFTSNTNFVENPEGQDTRGDFYSAYSISTIGFNENITLGSLDVTWINSLQTRFEVRRNRRVNLSLSNNQIIESNAWEGTIGTGYTFSQVPQFAIFSDGKNSTTSVVLRADFTYRDDTNIIRKISEETSQMTDGRKNISIKFSSDYAVMKDLTFRIYADWIQNNPYVSAVNTRNFSFGFSLRYVLSI